MGRRWPFGDALSVIVLEPCFKDYHTSKYVLGDLNFTVLGLSFSSTSNKSSKRLKFCSLWTIFLFNIKPECYKGCKLPATVYFHCKNLFLCNNQLVYLFWYSIKEKTQPLGTSLEEKVTVKGLSGGGHVVCHQRVSGSVCHRLSLTDNWPPKSAVNRSC